MKKRREREREARQRTSGVHVCMKERVCVWSGWVEKENVKGEC